MSFEHISGVLKLHPHITVFWCFCKISVTFEFSFLGVGLKMKTWKSRKNGIFWFFLLGLYRMDFCVYISLLFTLSGRNTITLFNCFYSDFRDFRDSRGFDRFFEIPSESVPMQLGGCRALW